VWNKFRIHDKNHKKDTYQGYLKTIIPYLTFTTSLSSWRHTGHDVGINQNVSSSFAGNSDPWIMIDGPFSGTG
jgi:hypothetical protein